MVHTCAFVAAIVLV